MSRDSQDPDEDYFYGREAQERDLRIVWECDSCGHTREDYPSVNEGGRCSRCTVGEYRRVGESYSA